MRENEIRSVKKKKVKTQAALIKQRNIIIGLTIGVIIISVTMGIVLHFIRRNLDTFVDLDSSEYYSRYTDKKKEDIAVYDSNNEKLSVTPDGNYYSTKIGTLIKLAKNGTMSQYAIVDLYSEKETLGINDRVLIFKHTEKKDIKSIEVHNEYGTYKFYKDSKGYFQIEGVNSELIKGFNQMDLYYFNPETFTSLVVSCGYTLTMDRLNKDKVSEFTYEEYGLATLPNGVTITDENKSKYTETYYILTDLSGNSYKVFIGNEIVSGAGYYVRLEGRENCVYILSSTLQSTVLQPIEALIQPRIIYPMTINSYFDVKNFILMRFNEKKYQDYIDSLPDPVEENPVEENPVDEITTQTEEDENNEINYFDTVVAFSYISLDIRENTKRQTQPYIMLTSDMVSYIPNDMNIDNCLQSLYNMQFLKVIKIMPTAEDLKEYELENPEHIITFDYSELKYEENGETKYMRQDIAVSKQTEAGTYYVYSEMFNMIVEVDRSYFAFLEYTDADWLSNELFDGNIVYCKEIEVKWGESTVKFVLDNTGSEVGKSENLIVSAYVNGEKTIVDNAIFRKFYQTLLYASFRGEADLTEEQMKEYQDSGDTGTQFVMTVKTIDDFKTDKVNVDVYRSYIYSSRRAYVTINGNGSFYMLKTMGEKITADVMRVINGEMVDPTAKY